MAEGERRQGETRRQCEGGRKHVVYFYQFSSELASSELASSELAS
jgi:hypothetical protein